APTKSRNFSRTKRIKRQVGEGSFAPWISVRSSMIGEPMAKTSELENVQRIGRYVDCTLLGHGGMGAVYRGRDPELDRPVAIKVMLQATEDFVARFRREAQSIARLQHVNI